MKCDITRIVTLTACCVVICGCGGHQLETATVTGKVTLDGKPLTHGTVVFTPEKGRAATGHIQPDGTFWLSTYDDGDGATIGKHRVIVACVEDIPGNRPSSPDDGLLFSRGKRSMIPPRYSDYSTSGLAFVVKGNGKNEVHLQLLSKPE